MNTNSNSPDSAGGSPSEEEYEQFARAAGAALRRPAPHDAIERLNHARRRRQLAQASIVGACALLVGIGVVTFTRRSGNAVVPSDSTVDTITQTVVTTPTPVTTAPPETTAATTTVACPALTQTSSTIAVQPGASSWSATGKVLHGWPLAATLLLDGRVLLTGPGRNLFDPASGNWTETGYTAEGYTGPPLTLLCDGKVLAAGTRYGLSVGGVQNADLYDPVSGTWKATASMSTARYGHTVTLLRDGRVLVAGGGPGVALIDSAELYDPASGTWTDTASMTTPRSNHTATLLRDGRVLVVGGDLGASASAELYDPDSETWTATGNPRTVRVVLGGVVGDPALAYGSTATLLPDGRVLVAGGGAQCADCQVSSAQLYDPSSGTWTDTASMSTRRGGHSATLLPDGMVLVVGGRTDQPIGSAELYDPASGTWTAAASMTTVCDYNTATLLRDGRVLVVGCGEQGAELYNPGTAPPDTTTTATPADRIAFTSDRDGNNEIYVMNADGTDQTRLTTEGGSWPLFSPDGTKIAFHSNRDDPNVNHKQINEIYVMNADGTDQTRLTTGGADGPLWSPDGTKIALDSDGIWVMNADGTGQARLTTGDSYWPSWSPDGTKIAFYSNRDGPNEYNYEIYVMNADGTDQTRLTTGGGGPRERSVQPVWSPDGTRIAFNSVRGGKDGVYVMNADGTDQTFLNIVENGSPGFRLWSPDGTRIVVNNSDGIWVLNADGTDQTRLTTAGDQQPSWSPDGTRIAFISGRDYYCKACAATGPHDNNGGLAIYVMNGDGTDQTRLTTAGETYGSVLPTWSPRS